MTNRVILIGAGVGAVLLVVLTVIVTVAVVGGGGGDGSGGGGEAAGQDPESVGPPDFDGEWRFVVALEEDESELLDEEMIVHMDLSRTEGGGVLGRGTAAYGLNRYEVEVEEGQVSQDGRLFLRLGGADEEGDDLLDFELFDDGEAGVSGSADGGAYFTAPDDPYGTAHADSVTFVGEAAGGSPPDMSGVWEGAVQVAEMGAGTLTLDLEQDGGGGLSGEIRLLPEGAPPEEAGSTPVSEGSVDSSGAFAIRNSEEPELSVSGTVEGETMDAEFLIEEADGTVPYDARRE